MLTTGLVAPFFWIEVAGCAACAVICFTPALRTNTLLVIGSLLAIAGIFCKRVQLLVGGFQIANLDRRPWPPSQHTAWDSGLSGIYGQMVYWPTLLEFGVTLGVVALGVLTGIGSCRSEAVPHAGPRPCGAGRRYARAWFRKKAKRGSLRAQARVVECRCARLIGEKLEPGVCLSTFCSNAWANYAES